jgi:ADP-ribosylation factor-like protein 8
MNANKVFLFGLDNAGKSTISHYLKTGQVVEGLTPTRLFSIDEFILNDIEYIIWDAPGQVCYRNSWKKGFDSANILLFILDTSQSERFQEAKTELMNVLKEPDQANVPLIFCFHKMDKLDAQTNLSEAEDLFGLNKIFDRPIYDYNTTIQSPQTLDPIKERLIEIIQKNRW